MTQLVFINLPVTDLPRAIRFYEAVGASVNPQFTDETAACMVFSETIFVMLLTHAKFAQFARKPIADAHATTQVLICLSRDSRAAVDEITDKAGAAGGVPDPSPVQDFGFLYGRSFEDPDGHVFEVMWMDMEAAKAAWAVG
ncbi:VOC family protein [Aureimonas sp. AU12]|uniref:VOC family protein n=1 Tax=Aureimonas sp. AU12 TaxID=1638161 RepID=UPI0007847396|nr:VOC family protein [Aureimonas sp. AU12]